MTNADSKINVVMILIAFIQTKGWLAGGSHMLLRSFKKSSLLAKIRRSYELGVLPRIEGLAGNEPNKYEDLYRQINLFEQYIEQLFDMIIKDKNLGRILRENNADRTTLKKIFDRLQQEGASQVIKGHYIPASSLSFGVPLKYALENQDAVEFETVIIDLINYFGNNRIRNI